MPRKLCFEIDWIWFNNYFHKSISNWFIKFEVFVNSNKNVSIKNASDVFTTVIRFDICYYTVSQICDENIRGNILNVNVLMLHKHWIIYVNTYAQLILNCFFFKTRIMIAGVYIYELFIFFSDKTFTLNTCFNKMGIPQIKILSWTKTCIEQMFNWCRNNIQSNVK